MHLRLRWPAIMAVMIFSLLFFFRATIGNGFQFLYGDSYDGLIEISILQHWFNVWTLGADWQTMNWFHPYAGTLAFNDTYILPGLFFTGARMVGADMFIAALASHVAMKAIGFLGMYALLNRGGGVSLGLSLVGAALFATANATLLHMHHAQLLSVNLIPWLMFFGIRTTGALMAQDRTALVKWGVLLAVGFGLSALNAFYLTWFFAFAALIYGVVALVLAGSDDRALLGRTVARHYPALLLLLLIAAIALLPLLLVYLPKVAEGVHHDWASGPAGTVLGPEALINVGVGNLVWGDLFRIVASTPAHGPAGGEARFGIPPGLLATGIMALVWLLRHRRGNELPLLLGISLVILIMLMSEWPTGFTPWYWIYRIVPGANVIRVVTRGLLLALVPLIFIVIVYLDRAGWKMPQLAILCGFLLLEQVQLAAPTDIERAKHMAMLHNVGAPPRECRSFFVVSARTDEEAEREEGYRITRSWAWFNAPSPDLRHDARMDYEKYRHNVDAMLISAAYDRPTINGYSTFNPADWNFNDPRAADYEVRVRNYAARHRLTGLCGLDMQRSPHWFRLPPGDDARQTIASIPE